MSSAAPRLAELIVRVRSLLDRFRSSLFALPALWILGGIALSQVVVAIDRRAQDVDFPRWLSTTVASSRALLGAIAGGTITAASVVFSLTLVAVQLSSSSYSSRVLRTFLRDRFQQNVMGLVLAAFCYSVLVMKEIRGPLDEQGESFVPRLSVAVAMALALTALLGLLASINHTSRQLRVSTVARRILDETAATIANRFPVAPVSTEELALGAPGSIDIHADSAGRLAHGAADGAVLLADRSGWVQQVSVDAVLDFLDEESSARLEVAAGTYVLEGSPLLTIWPAPRDGLERGRVRLQRAFVVGDERTMQQDVGLGIVMLEDIAVRALSPGINDPNTARVITVQLGEVILDLFTRDLGQAEVTRGTTRLWRPTEPTHEDYVTAAFDQISQFGRDQPQVIGGVIRTIRMVGDELQRRRTGGPEAMAALAAQLERAREQVIMGSMTESDRVRVLGLLDAE